MFFHDVNYLWGILSQLLFYATPIIYNPATIDVEILQKIANYGPTGSFITAVRNVTYDLRMPGIGRIIQLTLLGFGSFLAGAGDCAESSDGMATSSTRTVRVTPLTLLERCDAGISVWRR